MCLSIFRDSLPLSAFGILDLCLPFLAFPPDTCHNPALILPWVREFRGDSHFLPANNFTDAVRVCAASLVALPKWQLGMAVLAECLSTQLRDYVRVVGLGYSGKGDNLSHYQSEVI